MCSFNEKLIELIRNEPHLYDQKNSSYKNTIKKENTWKEIGVKLNRTSKDCAKRWKTLRDRYTKEKRAVQKSKASGAANYKIWKLMPYLEFLREHVSHRNPGETYPRNDDIDFSQQDSLTDMLLAPPYKFVSLDHLSLISEIETAVMAKNNSVMEKPSVTPLEDDSFHFGKFVAAKLRKLPSHVADDVMSAILLDIRNAERQLALDLAK